MNDQKALFDLHRETVEPSFDGATFNAERDQKRLKGNLHYVYEVMIDGDWMTLAEIQTAVHVRFQKHISEAGISARIRDFRKQQFASFGVTTENQNAGGGLWQYRMVKR